VKFSSHVRVEDTIKCFFISRCRLVKLIRKPPYSYTVLFITQLHEHTPSQQRQAIWDLRLCIGDRICYLSFRVFHTGTGVCSLWCRLLVTNPTEQSPSWEASSSSANEETSLTSVKPPVHGRIHSSHPPVHVMTQMNPVHVLPSYLFMIPFKTTFPSTPTSFKRSVSCRFFRSNSSTNSFSVFSLLHVSDFPALYPVSKQPSQDKRVLDGKVHSWKISHRFSSNKSRASHTNPPPSHPPSFMSFLSVSSTPLYLGVSPRNCHPQSVRVSTTLVDTIFKHSGPSTQKPPLSSFRTPIGKNIVM